MTEFPNKILLSQDKESKKVLDYWVINDYTDNIRKEYIQLDKACEWLEDNVFSSEQLDRNYSRKFREAMK